MRPTHVKLSLLRRLLHESGEVLLRAGRGEGTGDGEEDGLLPLGEVRDGDGLDVTGGVEVGEGGLRKLVADGDGGGDCGGFRGGEYERVGGMVVLEAKGGGEGELGRERHRLRWEESGGEVERGRGGKEARDGGERNRQ
ncbi:hypothetical protein TIFTF001_053255 [Ficus carica]|uniref:Uncharacterized protein n=1 Tax=Ficus carica TaxID=3494 RepID=A0AA88EHN0_FICCA|nr:hypothetical protein TIFTF001_053255 [Ficus carica]